MRRLCAVMVLALAACSQGGQGGNGGSAGTGGTPASGGSGGAGGDGSGGSGGAGFQLDVPAFDVAAGEDVAFCWHTALHRDLALGTSNWSSTMSPEVVQLVVQLAASDDQAEGTMERDCDALGGNPPRAWAYVATDPTSEMSLPPDYGMRVAADQKLVVWVHAINGGAAPTSVQAHLEVEGAEAGYVSAGTYLAVDTQIDIPPQSTGTVAGSCDIPISVTFSRLTTFTHKHGTLVRLLDGAHKLVETTDWQHPVVASFNESPYFTFDSSKLSYHCEYQNSGNAPLRSGGSVVNDEACVALGWYFPATGMRLCVNQVLLPE